MFVIESISKLYQLETLSIRYFQLNDLDFLLKFKNLKSLYLFLVHWKDSCTETISKLTQLQNLSLWSSNLTDVMSGKLSTLTKLQTLDLSYNTITDKGVDSLTTLINLKKIDLAETRVTQGFTKKLRISIPDIVFGELPGNPLANVTKRLEFKF